MTSANSDGNYSSILGFELFDSVQEQEPLFQLPIVFFQF